MQNRPIVRIDHNQPAGRPLTAPRQLFRRIYPGEERRSLLSLTSLEQFGRRAFIQVTDRAADALFPNTSSLGEPAIAGTPQNRDLLNIPAVFMASNSDSTTRVAGQAFKQTIPSISNELDKKMTVFIKRHDSFWRSNLMLGLGAAASTAAGLFASSSLAVSAAFSFLPITLPFWIPAMIVGAGTMITVGVIQMIGDSRARSTVRELAKLAVGREESLARHLVGLKNAKKVDYLLIRLPKELSEKVRQEMAHLNGKKLNEAKNDLPNNNNGGIIDMPTLVAQLEKKLAHDRKQALIEMIKSHPERHLLPSLFEASKDKFVILENLGPVIYDLILDLDLNALPGTPLDKLRLAWPAYRLLASLQASPAAYNTYARQGEIAPRTEALKVMLILLSTDLGLTITAVDPNRPENQYTQKYYLLPALPNQDPDNIGTNASGRFVAAGGMGEVYLGWDFGTNQQVAVKSLLATASTNDPEAVNRFKQEYVNQKKVCDETAEPLRSSYVAMHHYAVTAANQPAMVMEYLDPTNWVTLSSDIFSPTSDFSKPNILLRIGLLLARSLKNLHENFHMAHRDIKPGNVFYNIHNGQIKVGDFGLAKTQDGTDLTQAGMLVGTPSYGYPGYLKAPEVWENKVQNDIFGICATLYQLASGSQPVWEFSGQDGNPFLEKGKFAHALLISKEGRLLQEFKGVIRRVATINNKDVVKELPVEGTVSTVLFPILEIGVCQNRITHTAFDSMAELEQAFVVKLKDQERLDDSELSIISIQEDLSAIEVKTAPAIRKVKPSDPPTSQRLSGEEPTHIDSLTNPLLSQTPTIGQLTQSINTGDKASRLNLLRNIEQYVDDPTVAGQLVTVLQRLIKAEQDAELKAAARSAITYLINFIQDDLDDENGGSA
ncbi:MAG: serine/threonine-protein kinase [Candidatus Margulisiibacteriota bacterium]